MNRIGNRIVVVGTSCSGKTTLAKTIAQILGIVHIELDSIFWGPNWQEMETLKFRQEVDLATKPARWVVDGNYTKVREIIWKKADTIIWLNYSFSIVIWRALTRTIHRAATKEELFSGNRESFRQSFLSKNSILLWVITSYPNRRKTFPKLFENTQYTHMKVFEMNKPKDTDCLIVDIRKNNRS